MATREEWAKRARQWIDSELTTKELASEQGINGAGTELLELQARQGSAGRRAQARERHGASLTPSTTFVEVTPPASVWAEASSSIEVVDERYVVRVSDAFVPSTLARVLMAIEEGAVDPVDDEELLVPGAAGYGEAARRRPRRRRSAAVAGQARDAARRPCGRGGRRPRRGRTGHGGTSGQRADRAQADPRSCPRRSSARGSTPS